MNASTAIIAIIVTLVVLVVLVLLLPGHADKTPGQPSPHAIDQSQ
jgi:preprotein translocase subunit SecG